MDIHLHPSRGIPFSIEVGYFDTVMEIKEKIRKVKGIPISLQTLVFKGNVLQNQLNVHYSDILDQSHIQLLIAGEFSRTKIQLLVNILGSDCLLVLEMDVKETIQTLKEIIHRIKGIPVTRLVIHANGIELQDSKSLQDCELRHKSKVDVSFRLSSTTTSSGNVGSGPRKLKINALTRCELKRSYRK
ncbi:unnamed protein product [Fraxinus pennsylvanica]|uniref:Ubiquitin-like domain-containing protein n=1 Tax=Fraxinus pennsylvanica TaxID=56036 RepID=A0AAD2DNC6_9LAMI|nr:unnamed protein product [Fraxinus pennsylvanica]